MLFYSSAAQSGNQLQQTASEEVESDKFRLGDGSTLARSRADSTLASRQKVNRARASRPLRSLSRRRAAELEDRRQSTTLTRGPQQSCARPARTESVSEHEEVESCHEELPAGLWLRNRLLSLTTSIGAGRVDERASNELRQQRQQHHYNHNQLQQQHQSNREDPASLSSICGQLLTLVCGLLVFLYLIDFVQRKMTNLFTKILGGGTSDSQRRRSLAAGIHSASSGAETTSTMGANQVSPGGPSAEEIAAHAQISRSSLCLPTVTTQTAAGWARNSPSAQEGKSATMSNASNQSRRSSRSSIHSLFSALTGVISPQLNGRSIIAKNKEDTVIMASASPSIVAKESGEGLAASAQGATGCAPTGSQVSSPITPSPVVAASAMSPLANILGVTGSGVAARASPGAGVELPSEAAELVLADQSLFDTVRNPLGLGNPSVANVLALAAAAALEPARVSGGGGGVASPSGVSSAALQLPSVSTQLAAGALDQLVGGGPGASGGSGSAGTTSGHQHQAASAHGQLSSSITIKQAGGGPSSPAGSCANGVQQSLRKGSLTVPTNKRLEIIRLTESLLNALNQGDYDTYTRLCDPHMTSFEPENLGNLVDNMEYRRLCIDQARQLQIHHHLQRQGEVASQRQQAIAASVASAAAAAAAAAAVTCDTAGTPTSKQQFEQRQRVQQLASAAATAAAQSALANLSLGGHSNSAGAAQQQELLLSQQQQLYRKAAHFACASTLKQYSLVLNPNVYLIGEDAATIAYTRLSHFINLASGQLCGLEQSEETRVWHKRDGKTWACVHLHRSLGGNGTVQSDAGSGPQTSLSLLRSVAQQQQLANLAALQQQHAPSGVPLVSLQPGSNQTSQQQSSTR